MSQLLNTFDTRRHSIGASIIFLKAIFPSFGCCKTLSQFDPQLTAGYGQFILHGFAMRNSHVTRSAMRVPHKHCSARVLYDLRPTDFRPMTDGTAVSFRWIRRMESRNSPNMSKPRCK